MAPLVEPHEPLGRELRRLVDDIAEALPRAVPGDPGLAGGLAGMALFAAYLDRDRPGALAGAAEAWLSDAVDAVAAAPRPRSLYGGYTGVAWALHHLRGDLGLAPDDDPGADIDEALLASLAEVPWRGALDVVDGLVGFGVHALARLDLPFGRPLGAAILEQIVHRLAELAVERAGGTTWHTPPELLPAWQRAIYPHGYYNLGLAHGVPGILWLLAQACAHGIATTRARPLLDAGLRWLCAQRRPDDGGARFDRVIPAGGAAMPPRPSRIAWCYGDLGLSIALLQAARIAGDAAGQAEALRAAHRAAAWPIDEAGVADAGLCHGAAGNAHLFHRLYTATGDAAFRDTARTWLARTVALQRPGTGIAGFGAWMPDGSRGSNGSEGGTWRDDPGFLTGAAGVGLAVLAAISDVPPDWDRVLLASPDLGRPNESGACVR